MNKQMQYQFEILQHKLKNDKEFAKIFYECLAEDILHISKLTNIKDIKYGELCKINLK